MGMMELAGEIADGVLLNYCVPPDYNLEALKHIEIGAQKAGRTLESIDRPQLIVCSVDHNHKLAVQAAKELITQYLAQQPHIAAASGTPLETVQKVQSILGWPATKAQIHEAMQYVPDELIERITASGTPDEVLAKVEEYNRNGCTCPILYPVADDVRLMIDTFAQS
jgi:5,10-methylenetetrahydromethanopterin reductase